MYQDLPGRSCPGLTLNLSYLGAGYPSIEPAIVITSNVPSRIYSIPCTNLSQTTEEEEEQRYKSLRSYSIYSFPSPLPTFPLIFKKEVGVRLRTL